VPTSNYSFSHNVDSNENKRKQGTHKNLTLAGSCTMNKITILSTILCFSHSEGFPSYLDSLSRKILSPPSSPMNYLDSLSTNENVIPDDSSTLRPFQSPISDLKQTATQTPDEHYAKENPGAGWAGYQHPMFGGYLNNLKQNNWEDGKEADYGDDVRWGTQVYLDNM
jgi:hypothetical protein